MRPDNARPGPDCLMRKFNRNPPEEICVIRVLDMDHFTEFERALRGVMHNNVHCGIGATMCDSEAASAPEFFSSSRFHRKDTGRLAKEKFCTQKHVLPDGQR